MDRGSYPYWSVGAFSPSNRFAQSIKSGACGTCYEIRCVDNKQFAVRLDLPKVAISLESSGKCNIVWACEDVPILIDNDTDALQRRSRLAYLDSD